LLVVEIVPDSPDLSAQILPVDLTVSGDWIVPGAGWMHLDWLGWIYSYPGGWFYHLAHGFLYGIPGNTETIYLYDPDHGWLLTSRSVYPFVYDYPIGLWRIMS
jgi:hypothetical protein